MSRFNAGARERFVSVQIPGVYPLGSTPLSSAAPTVNDAPMLNVSPRTCTGLLTGNLAITMFGGTVPDSPPHPAAGGFTLTIYRVVPTLGVWAALAPYTGLNYGDQLVLPDISGGWGLFFQIGNTLPYVVSNTMALVGVAELA